MSKRPTRTAGFNSKDYVFRPTTLSAALMRAGIKGSHGPHMVREAVVIRPVREA